MSATSLTVGGFNQPAVAKTLIELQEILKRDLAKIGHTYFILGNKVEE